MTGSSWDDLFLAPDECLPATRPVRFPQHGVQSQRREMPWDRPCPLARWMSYSVNPVPRWPHRRISGMRRGVQNGGLAAVIRTDENRRLPEIDVEFLDRTEILDVERRDPHRTVSLPLGRTGLSAWLEHVLHVVVLQIWRMGRTCAASA